MNFPVQQLYAVDHSYQIHNSNSFDYTLPLNSKDDQSAYQMTNNFQAPVHQTNESSQVFPIFDPCCPTAYMSQMSQPYNNQLYTIPNSISGNNSMNYHHQLSNYSTNENRIDNNRYFMGYHPDYYRSPVMNMQQLVPTPVITTGPKATNFQLSSNQISVLNNNIQINNSIDTTKDDYITNNIKSIQTTTTTTTNEIIQKRFVQQCSPQKSYKSTRNKSKSIMSVKSTTAVIPNTNKPSSIYYQDQRRLTSITTQDCDQRPEAQSVSPCQFIDLMITNLDYNISGKEWKKLLLNQFQNAIKRVHSVLIQAQPDGSNYGIVRVNTIEDARLAISQFHRKKIGYKRIQVNILMNAANGNAPSVNIKQEVASLLKSVAGYSLSVYKFMELYEKRYHRNISISDFYKMKDFVEIKDVGGNQNWKIISLTNNAINSYKRLIDTSEPNVDLESMVCVKHCKEGTEDYITALESAVLPNVEIPLKLLKDQIHKMLQSHNGTIQLMSFLCCYKAEFHDMQIVKSTIIPCNSISSQDHKEPENLNGVTDINENIPTSSKLLEISNNLHLNKDMSNFEGVPLEHLLTCIPGIKLVTTIGGVKQIQLEDTTDGMQRQTQDHSSDSPNSYNRSVNGLGGILVDRLHQFSREVVDLMKHQPNCRMFLSKFIPTYHHHFGKQCRVAEYGFSKLHELLEALPQVVHVIGTGYMRMLYLGHKVQVRRFTKEMMKVLKSKTTKTCRLSDYPSLYKMVFHKDFNISDYGVCFMEDLLNEIPESTVEIIHSDDFYIAMPKRIQTYEEKERTNQFAVEVVDLLKQSPRCRLPFNKFIPSYHHHFSRQCKVADYGFTKLIELLEAVPNVIQVVEEQGEKFVILTQLEMLQVFAEQTLNMLEKSFNNRIILSEFSGFYLKTVGYMLILEDYAVNSLVQLIEKIPKIAKLQNCCIFSSINKSKDYRFPNESSDCNSLPDTNEERSLNELNEIFICLADRNHVKYLAHKVLLVLLEVQSGSLPDYQFVEKYHYKYREDPNWTWIQKEMLDVIQIINDSSLLTYPGSSGFYIRLKPFVLFARDLKDLMRFHQCKIPLMQLENIYEKHFGIPLECQNYGFPTIFSLIQTCDFVVTLKGRGMRAALILCQDFVGKLAHNIAYNTQATSQIPDNNDDIDCQHMNTPISTSPSKLDDNEMHFTSLVSKNISISSFMNLPRHNCPLQSVYNHNIYPPNNFLSTLNTYPPYFNHQPLYNPWFRQWYQPDQSYGYTPNLYSHPDFGVVSIAQSAMSNIPGSQNWPPYATACQDQKQIDELVETLAYDNSCSSTLTPPPATFQQIYHTIEANNSIINNPWIIYPSYQFLQSNQLVSGYNATVPNGDNEPVDEHPMEKLLDENQEHHGTNNNNQCEIIETSFRKIEFTKKFIFPKDMSALSKTIT